MPSHLIIATNSESVTKSDRDVITGYLEGRGWDVWHWFEDVWLVAGIPDTTSLDGIQSDIRQKVSERAEFLIFKVGTNSALTGWAAEKGIPWLSKNFPLSR